MQGAFPVNADWSSALDPENDDAVTRKVRGDLTLRELSRIARIRDPDAPAEPNDHLLRYVRGPFPPTPQFRLPDHGDVVFLLKKDLAAERLREGMLGHYLVTTVVDNVADDGADPVFRARPFILPVKDTEQDVNGILPGAPGSTSQDWRDPPNPQYCMEGRDYITKKNNRYMEIGTNSLRDALETAESLDLSFARRLEGLSNQPAITCWDCIDPDYDPSDRPLLRDQFIAKYLSKFYEENEPSDAGPSVEDVTNEVIEQHRALCQAWARKHYRCLTPFVTSPAEAVASDFYKHLETYFPPERKLSRVELARVFMRHPDMATDFAICLHNYINALEQSRGGRNASYKSMSITANARAASYKRFGDLLADKIHVLRAFFTHVSADPHDSHLHPYLVDWHAILGQMPQVHRFFDHSASGYGRASKRARNPADRDRVPPWKFGK